MPSKYQEYRQMADTAERQLTSSYKSWTQFLRTAARLYKYPYNEQVMIHAQRPDATACAEYDFWNKKMGRFVRRGSTGIALIDTSGQKPQLRYVFDVADTGEREHSRPVHLWQFRAEHEDAVAATMELRCVRQQWHCRADGVSSYPACKGILGGSQAGHSPQH